VVPTVSVAWLLPLNTKLPLKLNVPEAVVPEIVIVAVPAVIERSGLVNIRLLTVILTWLLPLALLPTFEVNEPLRL